MMRQRKGAASYSASLLGGNTDTSQPTLARQMLLGN
jgi:hypothetical protein